MTILFCVLFNLIFCDGLPLSKDLSLHENQGHLEYRNLRKRGTFGINSFTNFDPNAFVQAPKNDNKEFLGASFGSSGSTFGSSDAGYNQHVPRVSKFDPNAFTMSVSYPGQDHKQEVFDPNSPRKVPSASYNPNGERTNHYDPNEFVMPAFDPKEAASITFNQKKEPEPVFNPNNMNFGGFSSSNFMGITQSPINNNWDGSWPTNKEADKSKKVGKLEVPIEVNAGPGFGINSMEHEQTTARTEASWDGSWPGQNQDDRKSQSWSNAMTGKNDANSKAMDSWNAAMSGRDEFSEKTSNAWNNAVNDKQEAHSASSNLEKADKIIEHLMRILANIK